MKPPRDSAPAGVQPQRVQDGLVGREQLELSAVATLCGSAQRGLSVPRTALGPTASLVSPPLKTARSVRSFMCMLAASTFRPTTSVRLPVSPRARAQIGLFLLSYAV